MAYKLHLTALCMILTMATSELCTQRRCVYDFDLRWTRTLTYYDNATDTVYNVEPHHHKFVVTSDAVGLQDNDNGNSSSSSSGGNPSMIGRHVSHHNVITADGKVRNVITVNGKFPGPTIEVMEGAEVVVHVHNNLISDSASIHWHGLHQKESPWMDGVASVTQCPIPPGTTFTYVFKANPAGTHWYHSHLSNQRQDGLYGAFLIHRKPPPPDVGYAPIILSDWYLHDARTVRIMNSGVDEMRRHSAHMGGHHGGAHMMMMMASQIHNILINGRGSPSPDRGNLPLTTFQTTAGKRFKFHLIHAGTDFGYKLSIDGHTMKITGSDGFDISPVEADILYIYPGETIEFEIEAEQTGERFWMRIFEEMLHESSPGHEHVMAMGNKTKIDQVHVHHHHHHEDMMEDEHEEMMMNHSMHHMMKRSTDDGHEHHEMHQHNSTDSENEMQQGAIEGRAIITYEGLTFMPSAPTSDPKNCSLTPCKVFNCPGHLFKKEYDCILFNEIKGSKETNSKMWSKFKLDKAPDHEFVLNFIFSGHPGKTGSSINGRKFKMPPIPLYERSDALHDCHMCPKCKKCTHVLDLPGNKVVDLVFSNTQGEQGIYAHHPIHIHGHSFAVLYIGYPKFTNEWKSAEGILCTDKYCDEVKKTHIHSNKRHALEPQYNSVDPPIKDTILVPARGFAVVRIVTDNPGYWFLHCHVDQHLADGMAILLNSDPNNHKPVPDNFPSCAQGNQTVLALKQLEGSTEITVQLGAVVALLAIVVVLGILLAVAIVYVIRLKNNGSARI